MTPTHCLNTQAVDRDKGTKKKKGKKKGKKVHWHLIKEIIQHTLYAEKGKEGQEGEKGERFNS